MWLITDVVGVACRLIQGHLHSGEKRDCHAAASITHRRLFGGRKKESAFCICFCTFSYFSSPLLFFYYTNILFWGITYPSGLCIDMPKGEATELVYLWALGWSGKTKHRGASPPFLLHWPWRLAFKASVQYKSVSLRTH